MSEPQPTNHRDLDHLSAYSDAEIDEVTGDIELNGPREHHYYFAHYLLRHLAFAKPAQFVAFMGTQGALENLKESWSALGEDVKGEGGVVVESSLGLGARAQEIAGLPAAVVTMPEPEGVAEAFMIAAVLLPGKRWFGLFRGRSRLRYITLEFGASDGDEFRTVLGEWTKRGEHLNYGDGPSPNIHAFAKAVTDLIRGSHSAVGGMSPRDGVRA